MYAGFGMRVSGISRRGRRERQVRVSPWVWCATWAVVGVMSVPGRGMWAEKKPSPWVQISLESVGFPGVSSTFLGAGSSVLTVHFVDSSHLLVTYGLRKLVPRVEQDPEDHEDRLVAGVIVDLPSGKVEARTEWHMHDHARYLWSLGHGRFLLRIGEEMYTMAPLQGLGAGDAFLRTVFPGRRAIPSLVDVSADGGVMTVETVFNEGGKGGVRVVGDADTAQATATKAVIDFFRIAGEDGAAGFTVKPAGSVLSKTLFLVPVDADGYLWAEDKGGGVWGVTFDGFGGKTIDLGTIQSSCKPRLQMTSRSEFLAMTCQGSDERVKMASYGLDGTETWEDPLGDTGVPSFSLCAGGGAVCGEWERWRKRGDDYGRGRAAGGGGAAAGGARLPECEWGYAVAGGMYAGVQDGGEL